MAIQVGAAGPPHRDSQVAEFHVFRDGSIDIPAEIYRENGQLMIAIFAAGGGVSWEYPVADFLEAIEKGIGIVEGFRPEPPSLESD